MSTLNSSLMTLNNSKMGSPMPQVQAPAIEEQGKRFAQLMAKAEASARQAPPPVQAKPTPPDKTARVGLSDQPSNEPSNEPTNEASRAEANARSNAKTAARALATRALVKVPASEVKPQTEPRIQPHTGPHIEPHKAASDSASSNADEASKKSGDATAALSADMAAWVAALNPIPVQPNAAAGARQAGEMSTNDSELASQLATQTDGQPTVQAAADNNTKALREEADSDKEGHAPRSAADQRAAKDISRSGFGQDRAASEHASPSARDAQQPDARGLRGLHDQREALQAPEVRAAARAQTDLLTTSPSTAMANISTAATTPATTTATASTATTNNTDFSALMASSMAAASGSTGTGTGDANTLSLSLPTPVNAPEFRDALGVQVSLLARDGVQTAELHLNPADMGPVSIQIVMDGSQARVDFGADVAATRAAIEASMPELASALLDAGFTLAGGGVSQHAKGQSQAQTSDENRQDTTRRTVVDSSAAIPAAQAAQPRAQLTVGGVDLFA